MEKKESPLEQMRRMTQALRQSNPSIVFAFHQMNGDSTPGTAAPVFPNAYVEERYMRGLLDFAQELLTGDREPGRAPRADPLLPVHQQNFHQRSLLQLARGPDDSKHRSFLRLALLVEPDPDPDFDPWNIGNFELYRLEALAEDKRLALHAMDNESDDAFIASQRAALAERERKNAERILELERGLAEKDERLRELQFNQWVEDMHEEADELIDQLAYDIEAAGSAGSAGAAGAAGSSETKRRNQRRRQKAKEKKKQ
jgi:hypothetical protein